MAPLPRVRLSPSQEQFTEWQLQQVTHPRTTAHHSLHFFKPGPFTGSPSDQPVIHVVLVVLAYFLRFSLRVIFTTLRVFTSGFLPTLISDFRNTRSPALDLLPQRNDSSPSHSKTLCTEVCVLLLIRATTSTNIIWHFLYVYSCLCYFLVSCHVKLKVLEK